MEQPTPKEKQELHQLVDELPPGEIQTARRFLEYLARQPEDDETYTSAQQDRDIEAAAEIARGKGIPHEDVLRDCGL
jgi:broad specificity phosphatase PhoE